MTYVTNQMRVFFQTFFVSCTPGNMWKIFRTLSELDFPHIVKTFNTFSDNMLIKLCVINIKGIPIANEPNDRMYFRNILRYGSY